MVREKRRQKAKFRSMLSIVTMFLILFGVTFYTFYKITQQKISSEKTSDSRQRNRNSEKKEEKKVAVVNEAAVQTELLLSSVGDCTIGHDDKSSSVNSLPAVLRENNNDYSYFFKNVVETFQKDDITTANLETTFTNAVDKADKQFTFKAPPEYAKSLSLGSIEGVNVSNNHIYDYLNEGFKDTLDTLKAEEVNYFGEGHKWLTEVNGNKVGFLGYRGYYYDNDFLKKLKSDINDLKNKGYVVVINFHWGDENSYQPNSTQKYIAHYAVDQGAELIVGHHPHVIQGIEKYKNKLIAYSLGNFAFGGNINPRDKDTIILQTKFVFKDHQLSSYGIKVIPCRISSVDYINDYCPTTLSGRKAEEVINKLNNISMDLGFILKDDFVFIGTDP